MIVLPGPPRELHSDVATGARGPAGARECSTAPSRYESFSIRMFGVPESELAKALREIEEEHRPGRRWRSPPACAAAS